GTIEEFDEDLDFYQRMLTGGSRRDDRKKPGAASQEDRKRERQESAARRAEVAPLRRQIKDTEQKLARLRNELAKVEASLADPKTYDGAPERVIALGKDKARFES